MQLQPQQPGSLIPLPPYKRILFLLFLPSFIFFFFNDTATTEIYTLSLHDALPICPAPSRRPGRRAAGCRCARACNRHRSEEHTSELQSRPHLVCRLLLEKKKNKHETTARATISSIMPNVRVGNFLITHHDS